MNYSDSTHEMYCSYFANDKIEISTRNYRILNLIDYFPRQKPLSISTSCNFQTLNGYTYQMRRAFFIYSIKILSRSKTKKYFQEDFKDFQNIRLIKSFSFLKMYSYVFSFLQDYVQISHVL